ncbi:MAG: hypothetical protein M3Z54_02445 [Gemmatimonadota bacterium]|nr:hypothetical protein [Gemmatimonadota bacterium]
MNMQMDEADAGHEAEMSSGSDTAGTDDAGGDSARDTVPVPRLLLLPAR